MRISSRTPEGQPNQCPICGASVCLEPSLVFKDAPCPKCGNLLWFLNTGAETLVFERKSSEPRRQRLIDLLSEQLGVDAEKLGSGQETTFGKVDSLDLVELLMELEEEGDLDEP